MQALTTQEIKQKLPPIKRVSLEYGNQLLFHTSILHEPSSGVWGVSLISQEDKARTEYEYYNICGTSSAETENIKISIDEWSEQLSPFTQNKLLDEESQVKDLIYFIRISSALSYQESLANRLTVLFNDAKEDDFASPGINIGSLSNFYNFLKLHPKFKCPAVSLTPEYNIYASWKEDKNKIFSIHFLPNGDTRFVIFKPNDMHPERKIRLSGIATTDALIELVASSGVLDWISE